MIYLASDHRGYEMKEHIKQWLGGWGLEYVDCGPTAYNAEDDYPDFVAIAAEKVSQDPISNCGIILGGNGQGEAIVANRRRGVRAAVVYAFNEEMIKMTREHDASNVVSLGASFLSDDDAKKSIKLWLDTKFSEEPRHVRRIAKIDPQ